MVRVVLEAMQDNKREREKNTFIRQNKRDSHPNIWQAADPPAETTEGGVNCLIRCWGWEQRVVGDRGGLAVCCAVQLGQTIENRPAVLPARPGTNTPLFFSQGNQQLIHTPLNPPPKWLTDRITASIQPQHCWLMIDRPLSVGTECFAVSLLCLLILTSGIFKPAPYLDIFLTWFFRLRGTNTFGISPVDCLSWQSRKGLQWLQHCACVQLSLSKVCPLKMLDFATDSFRLSHTSGQDPCSVVHEDAQSLYSC